MLPIKTLSPKGETFWEGRQLEEEMHRGCNVLGSSRYILLLAILAFAWTLLSLLTSPMPIISAVPQQIIDITIHINENADAAMREERERLKKVTPILLPWAPETSPRVNSFSDLVKAKEICQYAHNTSATATAFEKQFGAHEFQHLINDFDGRERKIALFTGAYSNIRDGVSLTLNKMVAFLEENGHDILIFAPTNQEPALDAVGKILSVPSIPIPGRPEYRLSLLLSSYLQKELKKFAPDVVHIATPDIVGFQALVWAKLNSIPTACSYHTRFNSYLEYYNFGFAEPASWLIWGGFYGHCDHVYVPSKEIKYELEEHGIDNDIRIWARGVDPDIFSPAFHCPAWRNEIGIRESEVVILLVCRMVWEKNLELFARTIEELQASGLKFRSVVVGEGPARKELQERLTDTSFMGNLKGEDLSTAYASADIFFFPSTTETFGSTTLEAMSSGLPVVVANASGSNSLVSDNVNGFIADPDDVNSFVDYTTRLIQDSSLRASMGAEGRNIATTKFQYSKIFGDLIEYYSDLIVGDRIDQEASLD
jgi:glycosyltransferase involved in cell wall biosynthesis